MNNKTPNQSYQTNAQTNERIRSRWPLEFWSHCKRYVNYAFHSPSLV